MSRIKDFFKGVVSLALIVALLGGVPTLLLVIVGFPLPTEMPSIQLIRNHIEDGSIPDIFVVKTLALVVWIVWIQLAVSVLTEVFGLLRGRASGRAPVLPGIQIFAGKLVASTILIATALTPSRAATAAPIVPLVAEQIAPPEATAGEPGLVDPAEFGVDPTASTHLSASGVAQSQQPRAAGQYPTSSGDNWWDIAERLLGDGMRWSELRDLNRGKTMLTGEMISERTEAVRGGWRLDVPPDADSRLLETGSEQPDSAAADGDTAAIDIDIDIDNDIGRTTAGIDSDVDNDIGRTTAGIEAGSAETGDRAHVSSPLMRAIKPHTLIFEGPTGMIDDQPGIPYQVVEGDNLWDIAERHLGDPFRWPEIFEHSNQLQQTFGRQITDPNLIWPDSILWLPGDAVDVPPADVDLVLEVVGPLDPAETDTGRATPIQPDDLQSATDAARDTATAADLSSPAGNGAGGPHSPEDPDRGRRPVDGHTIRSVENANLDLSNLSVADRLAGPAGLAFGAGGLLVASGLLGMLARTRKLRLSESGERSRPSPPPMELVDIETVLRNSADSRRALSIHAVIRSLSDRPIMPGEPLAAPEVIRIAGDRIEVVQRGHDPDLPAPWQVGEIPELHSMADRSLAVLPAEFFPDGADDATTGSPAPTCVTIGGGLMVNLEAVGVLAIDGPLELAAGLIRSMVHELATGPARRSIDIRVSDWLPGADLHQYVRCGPLDNLVGRLGSWLEDVELSLTASGGFSAHAVRAAGSADTLPHSTVVFADVADADRIAPLVERAQRRSLPLAVVFSGDISELAVPPETVIRLDAETLRLEPHGFTAAMQYLDVDLILGAESLIKHARNAPMVLRGDDDQSTILGAADHPTDPAQAPTEETPEREIETELPVEEHEITDQAEDADTGMLVRVLGPVEFEGGPGDLSEPERSMLAFLALVWPSTAQQIKDAVWPGHGIDDAGFQSIVDRLHEALGPRFPIADDGRYRLRSVITDLGSARRWITQSQSMSEDRARNLLQLALADVRGEPFSGVGEGHWQWIADHRMALATQASSMLMDACFDLCDSAYGANDVYLAKWACDVGSLIDPLHETVITRKVQLLQLMGSTEEAVRVVEEWEAAYEEAAARPAPRGVRLALQQVEGAAPYVG